jgi:magnesium-transporting ATPase (P-type)
VAGALRARVTGVGRDSYANRLAEEARRFSLASSELMTGINLILRVLSWMMVVIGPILLLRQLQTQPWRIAVRLAVAGLVGMVPEGLVLLTTLAFLTAAVRLSRRRVLVQELPAVETLARVDALCVDKTGTLTEGGISFSGLLVNDDVARLEVERRHLRRTRHLDRRRARGRQRGRPREPTIPGGHPGRPRFEGPCGGARRRSTPGDVASR